jgi:nucleoside-specific outer membrane channel protein Tsx
MRTVTIEHAGEWEYVNNFFFVDMASANFASDKEYKIYGEWAPKISLCKVTDSDLSFFFVKDIRIAGELNQGDNFRALNIGLGLALEIPTFTFFDLNLFHRDDNFNDPTAQLTLDWQSRFSVFKAPLIFEGFFDYYGNDYGTEIVTQPHLLLDGKLFSDKLETLHAGFEFYYYKSSATPWRSERINELVLQLMVKWIW